jgi:hypothetical protein
MAECCQWASERACVTSPFLDKVLHHFFSLMVICNSLLLLKSLPINIINCIKFYVNCSIIFLFIHKHLTLRKWCYTPLQHDSALDPMIPSFVFHFSNICHVTTRKPRLPQCIMGDDLHINKQTNIYTECVGKKRFNGRVLPTGFGKSMCYVPPFWTRYYIIFFSYGYL